MSKELQKMNKSIADFFANLFAVSLLAGIVSTWFLKSKHLNAYNEFVPYAVEMKRIGFGIALFLTVIYFLWSIRSTMLKLITYFAKSAGKVLWGSIRTIVTRISIMEKENIQTADSFAFEEENTDNTTMPNTSFLPVQPKVEYEKTAETVAKYLPTGLRRLGMDEDLIQGIKVVNAYNGPASGLIELEMPNGLTQSKIENLTKDLKAALGVPSLQVIEGSAAGRASLIVGHKTRAPVYLRSILESPEFKKAKKRLKLPVPIGVDPLGKIIFEDLTKFPHTLIAGATNSGKSIWLAVVIYFLAFVKPPAKLKLLLIDPKKVEFPVFEPLPHVSRIETDPSQATEMLQELVAEMDGRFHLFQKAKVKNIEGYNEKVQTDDQLPYIVVFVDELNDLMMVAGKDILEPIIVRLGQLARAAGIHLVIATQRPSVKVVTGVIKANLPTRICFSLTTQADYATVFGPEVGTNFQLRGQGDGVARIEGRLEGLLRFQGPIISLKEREVEESVEKLIRFWEEKRRELGDVITGNKTYQTYENQGEKGFAEANGFDLQDKNDEIIIHKEDEQKKGVKSVEDAGKLRVLEYQIALKIIDTIEHTPEGRDIFVSANKIRSQLGKNINDVQQTFDNFAAAGVLIPERGKGYRILDEEAFYRVCDEYETVQRTC